MDSGSLVWLPDFLAKNGSLMFFTVFFPNMTRVSSYFAVIRKNYDRSHFRRSTVITIEHINICSNLHAFRIFPWSGGDLHCVSWSNTRDQTQQVISPNASLIRTPYNWCDSLKHSTGLDKSSGTQPTAVKTVDPLLFRIERSQLQ